MRGHCRAREDYFRYSSVIEVATVRMTAKIASGVNMFVSMMEINSSSLTDILVVVAVEK